MSDQVSAVRGLDPVPAVLTDDPVVGGGALADADDDLAVHRHGRLAAPGGQRRDGRQLVVEEAAVLVVVEDEDGLLPHLGLRRQGGEQPGGEVLAVRRRVVGVLGERGRGDDPGHLRQLVGLDVGGEGVDQGVAHRERVVLLRRVADGPHPALVQRLAGLGLDEGGEPGERVVVEVVQRLVGLPADAGPLQALGVGGPLVAAGDLGVVGHRGVPYGAAAGPGHQVVAVGVGVALDGRVVGVTGGEHRGERVVEGHVGALVVALAEPAAGAAGDRAVGEAVVPGLHRVHEAEGGRALLVGAGVRGVHREGQQVALLAARVGLVEHRAPVDPAHRRPVAEAADARQGAEVVVERAVLLHQHHDVLDVREPPGLGRRGERLLDADREGGQHGGRRRAAEQAAARQFGHRTHRVGLLADGRRTIGSTRTSHVSKRPR